MIKLLKIFSIAFLLVQFTASARYYSSEMGRFINRDPMGNPQDPRAIVAQNEARYQATVNREFIERDESPRYSEPNGYHDGMSLYNGYFAQKFALDPSGNILLPAYTVKGIAAGMLIKVVVAPPPTMPKHYVDCKEDPPDGYKECVRDNKLIEISNKSMYYLAKKALKPVVMETTQYAIESLQQMPTRDVEEYMKERIDGLETRLVVIQNIIDPPYADYMNCCSCPSIWSGFSGGGSSGDF